MTNNILQQLRHEIEEGKILVKVAQTQGGYKETQLIDKETGYKLIPEHIVPIFKGETYEDRFLKQAGIKRDKDGTPDIVGKVMGDYHKAQLRALELNKKAKKKNE